MWEMEDGGITESNEGLMNSDSHLTCIQFRNCLSACGPAAYAVDIRKFK